MTRFFVLIPVLAVLFPLRALAGCGDAFVERVDWVEVKYADDGKPTDAELQVLEGFSRKQDWRQLAREVEDRWRPDYPQLNNSVANGALVALALLYGEGDYLNSLNIVTATDFAHPEGEAGAAAVGPNWPGSPRVGGGAQNPNLESTVMALPANAAPNVAGGHDVGASARAPNAGCAAAPGPVFAALAFLAYRRRRPAPSPSMGRGLG